MKLWSFLKGRKSEDAREGQPEEAGSGKDLDAALAAIRKYTKEPPTKALDWLRRHPDLSVPALIRIIEGVALSPKQGEDKAALSCALYMLAELRATDAYPAVIALCRLPEEEIEEILGDIVAQDLDRILASICGSDVEPLKAVIGDATISEWTRAAAVGAFPLLVFDGRLGREQVIEYYRHLLETGLERSPTFVWSAVVAEACTLHPGELLAPIRRAYADGLVDESVQSLQEVLADAKKAQAALLAHNRKHSRGMIRDAAQDMSWMSGIGQADEEAAGEDADLDDEADELPDEDIEEEVFVAEPVRSGPKVGRNEPCPCGSGKKFKKCCGA